MKIGIYESRAEVQKALMRFAVANEIYTRDIDCIITEKDDAYILEIKEED